MPDRPLSPTLLSHRAAAGSARPSLASPAQYRDPGAFVTVPEREIPISLKEKGGGRAGRGDRAPHSCRLSGSQWDRLSPGPLGRLSRNPEEEPSCPPSAFPLASF